jgi:hypothetical protein
VNDQTIALLVGFAASVALSVLNAFLRWIFPPGRASTWAIRHSLPIDDDPAGPEDEKG